MPADDLAHDAILQNYEIRKQTELCTDAITPSLLFIAMKPHNSLTVLTAQKLANAFS